MTNDEYTRVVETESRKFCNDWPNGLPAYKQDMELFFEKGAAFGRELGHKETIEALNNIEVGKYLDKYELETGHRPTNDHWADWLTKRFGREKE